MLERFAAWYFVCSGLYLLLIPASVFRLHAKFVADGRLLPPPVHSRPVYSVFILLCVYAVARSIVLVLIGAGSVSDSENLDTAFFDTVPSLLFALLQVSLIRKWTIDAARMAHAMHVQPSAAWGYAVWGCLAVLFAYVIVTALAIVNAAVDEPALNAEDSLAAVNVAAGVVYALNGAAFIVSGVVLRSKWHPATDEDHAACRRVLALALVFGGMCVTRGLLLLLYSLQGHKQVQHVVHAGWASVATLNVEVVLIWISLFWLTSRARTRAAETVAYSAQAGLLNDAGESDSSIATGVTIEYGPAPSAFGSSARRVGGGGRGPWSSRVVGPRTTASPPSSPKAADLVEE